eukprot:747524-Hanusia_phi.AAC.3
MLCCSQMRRTSFLLFASAALGLELCSAFVSTPRFGSSLQLRQRARHVSVDATKTKKKDNKPATGGFGKTSKSATTTIDPAVLLRKSMDFYDRLTMREGKMSEESSRLSISEDEDIIDLREYVALLSLVPLVRCQHSHAQSRHSSSRIRAGDKLWTTARLEYDRDDRRGGNELEQEQR